MTLAEKTLEYAKKLENRVARFSCHLGFYVGLLFMNFSSCKPDTENVNFDTISLASKHANINEVKFF